MCLYVMVANLCTVFRCPEEEMSDEVEAAFEQFLQEQEK